MAIILNPQLDEVLISPRLLSRDTTGKTPSTGSLDVAEFAVVSTTNQRTADGSIADFWRTARLYPASRPSYRPTPLTLSVFSPLDDHFRSVAATVYRQHFHNHQMTYKPDKVLTPMQVFLPATVSSISPQFEIISQFVDKLRLGSVKMPGVASKAASDRIPHRIR